MTLSLGYVGRFLTVDDVSESYDVPKKVCKFRRRLTSGENIAWLPDNRIIVCDKLHQRVHIYSAGGKYDRSLAGEIRPEGVSTTASGMIAVVDIRKRKERRVTVYCENGNLYARWGEDLGNWKPKGIAFTNRGHLVVSQVTKKGHSVGLYTVDGKELRRFGDVANGDDSFDGPYYVAVDIFDRIVVSDKNNHVVKLYDERGTFLGKIGGYGSGKGQLRSPRGVCSDASGNIFVCDCGNRRVSVFSLHGQFIQDLLTSKQGLGYPFGIAYNREANQLAVSQNYSNTDSGHLRKIRIYQLNPLSPLNIKRKSTIS